MDAFLAGLLDGLRLVVDVVAGPGAAAQVAFDGRAGLSEESQWGLLQVDLLNIFDFKSKKIKAFLVYGDGMLRLLR